MASSTTDRDTFTPVLIVACAAAFLSFLDVAVVNLAVSAISTGLGANLADVTWVMSGYAIPFAATLAVAGRCADLYGHRRILLTGLFVFAMASVACAAAPTLSVLVAARVAQGVGAAAMLPAALGALLAAAPAARVPSAIGAWSAAGAFAAALGPAAGAMLVDAFGWQSVFAVNIPACVLLFVAARAAVPATDPASLRGRPDFVGAVLMATAVACAVSVLTHGDRWGWSSPTTVALAIGAMFATSAVINRSLIHPHPVLQIAMLQSRPFAVANLVSACFGFALFTYLLAIPQFFTTVWNLSLLQAAGCVAGASVVAMLAAGFTGRHARAGDARWYAAAGMVLSTCGYAALGTELFGPARDWLAWTAVATALGVGVGMTVTALSVITAASTPPSAYSAGIGMNLTSRQIGGALGVATFAAVVSTEPGRFVGSLHSLFTVLAAVAAVAVICALFIGSANPSQSRPDAKQQHQGEPSL
ncbi:MFS transporter [Nocardia asteroides]|uniref:MFS transporter n=1 Tax=Nocardia asteroides TaxID=1824 RepID=UPI0037C549C4